MDFKIKFSGRSHKYLENEIEAVVQAMKDADPLTQGKYRDVFEADFSDYIGASYSFAVCNATAGLEMVAQLCEFKEDDEFIIPSHTYTSSAYPFVKKGATPVWADIDLQTLVVTADTIRPLITKRTKAIVVVHLYGYVAHMPSIVALANEYNLLVIEDAAQSIGSDIDGQQSGTFGDYGIFSFHSHKNMTTLGEGGMVTVKDPEVAAKFPMLRHNGHCNFDYNRENYWIPAMGHVDIPKINGTNMMPNNVCLGEIESALGIQLLKRLDSMNQEKRGRALAFIDALKDYPELVFNREESTRHNYHLLVAQITEEKRNNFLRKMSNEEKIQCVVQYYPLNRYDFYKKLGFGTADCPNTDAFFDNMVSFPFQQTLSEDDLRKMVEATKNVLDQLRN